MTGPHTPDEQLSRLLHDTVDGIEPQPGLEAIRSRTLQSSPKESTMSIARTWLLGGLGGAVATAAVIGGVYLASNNDDPSEPGPITPPSSSSPSVTPSESASPTGGSSSAPAGKTVAVPVYYAGDVAGGTYLYREFIRVDEDDRLADALRAAANGDPADPDYRSLWPSVAVLGVHVDGSGSDLELTIDLGGKELHDRPAGMSEREAQLAIEQMIYTVQGAAGSGRPPVRFLLDGDITDQVLGVPTSEPLANGELLDTLSHINLTTPAEGDEITGDTLSVSGVANSFEANVVIRLQRYEGTAIVLDDFLTADGAMEPKLFPFSGSFDISQVPAGKYILHVMTDDPSGGEEGPGAFTDSKVITIR